MNPRPNQAIQDDSYRLRDAHNLIDVPEKPDFDDGGGGLSASLKKKSENGRIKTDQQDGGDFQRIATFNNEVNLASSYANHSSHMFQESSMPTNYSPSKQGSP
mmetsp:Transcript_6174/g.9976  ORF Transcript_6174/g.9976 Transcript_6174/m.9976 type:complete len:103 (-) Transcript_6174:3797-4105(-)